MEFATEMIIKSAFSATNREVPITLHPDGRKSHAPHLKTFRDGWRTLRFFLMQSTQVFSGARHRPGSAWIDRVHPAVPGVRIGHVAFDAHTLLFSSLFVLCGYQTVLFAIFTKTFAVAEGLHPEDPRLNKFFELLNLERGLALGLGAMLFGCAC